MMTSKNYLILAAIVAVLVLAYVGILNLFGFTEQWGWLRLTLFVLLTYILAVGPLLIVMKVWGNVQDARQQAFEKMKAESRK